MPVQAPALPDEDTIRTALRRVVDPEVGLNIVDLGLIYRIDSAPGHVLVEMTMTSPACPLGEVVVADVKAALADMLPASCHVEVRLVWDPPWDPAMISKTGKLRLGW